MGYYLSPVPATTFRRFPTPKKDSCKVVSPNVLYVGLGICICNGACNINIYIYMYNYI
jgi:hypothetical protein